MTMQHFLPITLARSGSLYWSMVQGISGAKHPPADAAYRHLLPSDSASIQAGGICFKGMFYVCDQAEQEQWFAKARNHGRRSIDLWYDMNSTEHVWLLDRNGQFVPCKLRAFEDRYRERRFEEVADMLAVVNTASPDTIYADLNSRVQLDAVIDTLDALKKAGWLAADPFEFSKRRPSRHSVGCFPSALSFLNCWRSALETLKSCAAFDMEDEMEQRMNIGELCRREVVFATENMSLKEAAQLMRVRHVGSLVVVREARLGRIVVGMLTDRDIAVIAMARDFDPQSLQVTDVMSSPPVTVRMSESVSDVLGIMRQHGIRRIPVTTDDGVLVGIVTLDDLLEIFAEDMQGFVQTITNAQKREARVRG